MTDRLTGADLDRLDELDDAAAPGPWPEREDEDR